MRNIFFISDTHLRHANILKFRLKDDTPMRPFASVEEMDETMIERWNSVVKPHDKVYHLGDVAMTAEGVMLMRRCNGKKRLVMGNHDTFGIKAYTEVFDELYGSRLFNVDGQKLLCSHIPLHLDNLKPDYTCLHGHVHNNVPHDHYGPQFINLCVEYTNYTPVPIDAILTALKSL